MPGRKCPGQREEFSLHSSLRKNVPAWTFGMELGNSLALGIDKKSLVLPNHGLNLKNDQLIFVFGKYQLVSLMSSASLPQLAARPSEPPRPQPRPAGPAPPARTSPRPPPRRSNMSYRISCDKVQVTSTEIGENIKSSQIKL